MTFEVKLDDGLSKEERYKSLLSQINSLISGENNFITNLANITSDLKYSFENFLWVVFYLLDEDKENGLILGPFQGEWHVPEF